MADIDPGIGRIAKLIRQLDTPIDGVRRKAFAALECTMESERFKWVDVSNAIEKTVKCFTEAEMQELVQARRADAIEDGIKIGMARASNGGSTNDHLTLPSPAEMAEFCQARQRMLKDDAQRKFIDEMV